MESEKIISSSSMEKLSKRMLSYNSMHRNNLGILSKQQRIELSLKKENKPIGVPRTRKSVRQLVTEYENKIIPPPPRCRDPVAPPWTKIILPLPQFSDNYKPVAAPRIKVTKLNKALEGAVKSYGVDIKNQKDSLGQLNSTNKWIKSQMCIK